MRVRGGPTRVHPAGRAEPEAPSHEQGEGLRGRREKNRARGGPAVRARRERAPSHDARLRERPRGGGQSGVPPVRRRRDGQRRALARARPSARPDEHRVRASERPETSGAGLRRVFFETDAARALGVVFKDSLVLFLLEDVVHVLLGVPAPGLGLCASERALRQEKVRERAHDGADRRGEPRRVPETTSPERVRQPPEPDRRRRARRRAQQLGALRRESQGAAAGTSSTKRASEPLRARRGRRRRVFREGQKPGDRRGGDKTKQGHDQGG